MLFNKVNYINCFGSFCHEERIEKFARSYCLLEEVRERNDFNSYYSECV